MVLCGRRSRPLFVGSRFAALLCSAVVGPPDGGSLVGCCAKELLGGRFSVVAPFGVADVNPSVQGNAIQENVQ